LIILVEIFVYVCEKITKNNQTEKTSFGLPHSRFRDYISVVWFLHRSLYRVLSFSHFCLFLDFDLDKIRKQFHQRSCLIIKTNEMT